MMIKLTNLTYKIKKRTIFKDLNLEIKQGEFIGLIGDNGSGKTTLLRIILGLNQGYKGEITLKSGIRINYQPETTNKKLNVDILSYLRGYAVIYGIPVKEQADKLSKVIELLDLEWYIKNEHKLNQLSKGYLQRVSLARCLLNDPDLIILDEPFSNIDSENKAKIMSALIELRGKVTILISSHNFEEIKRLSTRVIQLKDLQCFEISIPENNS